MGKQQRQSGRLKRRHSRGVEMELKQPLAERVAAYALAAGAAGLGIMAGAQPAEAQIVYTPAHIHFENGSSLDLNNDGVRDFVISQTFSVRTLYSSKWTLRVGGRPGNGVRGYPGPWASRLAEGAKIGAGEAFYRGNSVEMAFWSDDSGRTFSAGPWTNGTSGFLGLQFQIDGQAHYGWAEVFITGTRPFRGVVKGYAYNTVPNQPILAGQRSDRDLIGEIPPQPATLGLLALGAPGLDIWRPRKSEMAAK